MSLGALLATIALWFASTALVMWAAHRPRATFARSLWLGGIAAALGVVSIVFTRGDAGPAAAYASFAGGLAVWGWHELAFLTGAVAGARRSEASATASGWNRFVQAASALIHHEIALAATAMLLAALSWGAANTAGASAFALLLALRLSAKLNLHIGVPNVSDELLPPHLRYLKSYFRRRPFGPVLALSLAGSIALAAWLGARASEAAPGSGEAVAASLLFALAALGALEHLFLAAPLRDAALWRWAIPARPAE